MKYARSLVLAIGCTLGALVASAQTTTPAPAAAPAVAPAKKEIPLARVAWINSSEFTAEEGGVKKLVKVLKELELEFSGQQGELSVIQEKLRTIVGELQKLQAGGEANAEAFKAKQTEGVKLQQEFQQKQQAFQQAVGQAQQAKQGPVVAELSKAIVEYSKERDLAFIFDVAKMGDAVVAAKPELDLTDDFIAYYNAKFP